MSIIERAINKLNDPKSGDDTRAEKESKVSSEPLSAGAHTALECDNSRVTVAPDFRTEKQEDTDGRAQAEDIVEVAVEEGRQELPLVDKPAAPNHIFVDFDHLIAAGMITPESRVTEQSEQYQHLKRRLLGNMVPGMATNTSNSNLIMVTSSVPSEGKTYTCVNLAMSMAAEIDRTVLAIDTDIAKRDLTRAFGATGKPGLFDLLGDDSLDVSDVILGSNISNFSLIPAGLGTEINTELLASARMRELTEEIGKRYPDRIVIFDTPPVLASSAALAFAPQMGQIILVVEAAKTKQETLREALHLLEDVKITGLLFNKSRQSNTSSDYYGYYSRAGAD